MLDKGLIYDVLCEFCVKITIITQRKNIKLNFSIKSSKAPQFGHILCFDSMECIYKCSIIIIMFNNSLLPSCISILDVFSTILQHSQVNYTVLCASIWSHFIWKFWSHFYVLTFWRYFTSIFNQQKV